MDTQPTAFIAALAPVSPQRAHFGAHFGAHSPPPCMAWTQQHRALARPAAAARGAMCRFAPAAGARAARGAHRRARRSQGRRRRRTRRPSPRRRPPARARAPPGRARPAPRRRLRAARVTPGAPAQALAMPRTQALTCALIKGGRCTPQTRGLAPERAGVRVHARHLRQRAMETRDAAQNNTNDGVVVAAGGRRARGGAPSQRQGRERRRARELLRLAALRLRRGRHRRAGHLPHGSGHGPHIYAQSSSCRYMLAGRLTPCRLPRLTC